MCEAREQLTPEPETQEIGVYPYALLTLVCSLAGLYLKIQDPAGYNVQSCVAWAGTAAMLGAGTSFGIHRMRRSTATCFTGSQRSSRVNVPLDLAH